MVMETRGLLPLLSKPENTGFNEVYKFLCPYCGLPLSGMSDVSLFNKPGDEIHWDFGSKETAKFTKEIGGDGKENSIGFSVRCPKGHSSGVMIDSIDGGEICLITTDWGGEEESHG